MKKRLLITSILSIVMCFSLVCGATFALFTSESKVNIAVTSGTVSVMAVPEIVEEETSMYSGSASIDENGKVVIDKMLPMDYVKVNVAVDNLSDVNVKYRTVVVCEEDNALTRELVVTVDGAQFSGLAESKWSELKPSEDGKTIEILISLPEKAYLSNGNNTCTLSVTVEAVQGNATTYDPLPPAEVIEMTAEELFLQNGGERNGKKVTVETLAQDIQMETGLVFAATEGNAVEDSQYKNWLVDYEISFDKDIVYVYDENDTNVPSIQADLFLIGEYATVSGDGNEKWVPLPMLYPGVEIDGVTEVKENGQITLTLPAGTSVRIMRDLFCPVSDFQNTFFTYDVIVNYVNVFQCGIVTDIDSLDDINTVSKLQKYTGVELSLCIYETENGVEKENGVSFEVVKFTDTLNNTLDTSGAANDDQKAAKLKEELENINTEEATIAVENADLVWVTGGEYGLTPIIKNGVTETLTFDGGENGATFTATGSGVGAIANANKNGKLIFKNVTFYDESVSYAESNWEFLYLEFDGIVEFYDCTFKCAVMMSGTSAKFVNCSFDSNKENEYDVWIDSGDATFVECIFLGYRGLKIHEDYGSEVGAVTVDTCQFGPLIKKPGIVIGTLNADTTVSVRFSTFTNCQAGDQGKYIYESDTDVDTFTFILEGNNIVNE